MNCRFLVFERFRLQTEITKRYQTKQSKSSVEEALIEMCLAGVSAGQLFS